MKLVIMLQLKKVSVPIRGLFNLTPRTLKKRNTEQSGLKVSVPIRGLFNLTNDLIDKPSGISFSDVSVPIRGLFNLTNFHCVIIDK